MNKTSKWMYVRFVLLLVSAIAAIWYAGVVVVTVNRVPELVAFNEQLLEGNRELAKYAVSLYEDNSNLQGALDVIIEMAQDGEYSVSDRLGAIIWLASRVLDGVPYDQAPTMNEVTHG